MVQGIGATARATPGAGGPRRRASREGAGTGPCEAPVSPATETMWGRHGGQERQGAQRQVVRGAKAVGVGGVGCPRWEDK